MCHKLDPDNKPEMLDILELNKSTLKEDNKSTPLKVDKPPDMNMLVFLNMPPPHLPMLQDNNKLLVVVNTEEDNTEAKSEVDNLEEKEPLLPTSPSKAESSTFPSKRNTLNTNKSKRSTKSLSSTKKLNTKKSSETKEFPTKEPSPTTTLLRLKLSTSEEKSKRPSWSKSQSSVLSKESNTFPSKPRSCTTPREKTTFLNPPKPELSISALFKTDMRVSRVNTEAVKSEEKENTEKSEEKVTMETLKIFTVKELPVFQEVNIQVEAELVKLLT
eukprot:TRINITY_DN1102_c0_g1_i11.p1 TRINITY_DN1102_c0_g1~~TRINITY_DN1102_c0_g1_i11.p1  ORF type:complete len:273 (+),score=40.91 TRINITY_DN1102_c0_g1_i11:2-820(+)